MIRRTDCSRNVILATAAAEAFVTVSLAFRINRIASVNTNYNAMRARASRKDYTVPSFIQPLYATVERVHDPTHNVGRVYLAGLYTRVRVYAHYARFNC